MNKMKIRRLKKEFDYYVFRASKTRLNIARGEYAMKMLRQSGEIEPGLSGEEFLRQYEKKSLEPTKKRSRKTRVVAIFVVCLIIIIIFILIKASTLK